MAYVGMCRKLEEARKNCEMNDKMHAWDWKHFIKTRDKEVVKKMGKLIKYIRRARGKSIKEVLG